MTTRGIIEREVGKQWADFERDHPALAGELDRAVVIAEAEQRLREDPAYQAATREGRMLEAVVELVGGVLARVIRAAGPL